MDLGFSTFNINTINHNQIDPNEFHNQKKEIEGALSAAFDDLTSIQNLSDDEDHYISIKNGDNSKSKYAINGCNTSTPLINNNNNQIKTNGLFKYNINDIPEEDTIIDVDSLDFDDRRSLSLSDHLDDQQPDKDSHYLLHNDVQFKDLRLLKKEFAQINSNYEMLQDKYQQLINLNEQNVKTIELLQNRNNSLEKQLKNERKSNEDDRRKASIFESKVNSLEYQLKELKTSDYLSRNNEEQMKWFETLKIKHQKELNNLRENYESKIENLTKTITNKEDELISNCNIILKYKQEAHYFQEKMKNIEDEMRLKIQQEVKKAKEQTELNLLNTFDESMKKLKIEWEQKLQEDIQKIVTWFESWDLDQEAEPLSDVRFENLVGFCESLKRSTIKREIAIQAQIDRMEEAKRQLEKVILEAKLRNSSISSTSSRSDLLLEDQTTGGGGLNKCNSLQSKKLASSSTDSKNECTNVTNHNHKLNEENGAKMLANLKLKYEMELRELREELESQLDLLRLQLLNKEEESALLKQKTNKYKQHYHLLVNKHKDDLNLLKSEFTKVMQQLINCKNT